MDNQDKVFEIQKKIGDRETKIDEKFDKVVWVNDGDKSFVLLRYTEDSDDTFYEVVIVDGNIDRVRFYKSDECVKSVSKPSVDECADFILSVGR